MSQAEALLLHQLNLLATAVVVLVLLLAAAIGAASAFAQAWSRARFAAAELRSWYRGHAQQRTVEGLMRQQVKRELSRSLVQPVLPSGERQREPEARVRALPDVPPPSSKPAPLDQTWPSLRSGALAQPHSGKTLAAAHETHTPRPPPLPDSEPEPSGWEDSELRTEQVTDSMLLRDEPANDEAEPMPLVQQLTDKTTWVWPRRKLPRIE